MPPSLTLYTSDACPFCEKAKAYFKKRNLSYVEIDAPKFSPAREEAYTRSGRTSVPQIFIDSHHVGGYEDLVVLVKSGDFDKMMKL